MAVQGSIYAEFSDDILTGVVREMSPALCRAGKWYIAAFAFHERVKGEVDCQSLGNAVCIVVRDEADDVVGTYLRPGPCLPLGESGQFINLMIVEHLGRVRLWNSRMRFTQRQMVRERKVMEQMHTVCLEDRQQDPVSTTEMKAIPWFRWATQRAQDRDSASP